MLNISIAKFLQYCYSAILNIELHCSKYCKKYIYIFNLTLSPLFCLSSLTLSPLSLISHPCLSSLSLHRRTQQPQPSTISRHPQQPPATQHHITLISHPCLFIAEPSTRTISHSSLVSYLSLLCNTHAYT